MVVVLSLFIVIFSSLFGTNKRISTILQSRSNLCAHLYLFCSPQRYVLRGCIGTLQPRETKDGIRNFALNSAFRDRRFPSISQDEIPFLSCGISLLHRYTTPEHSEGHIRPPVILASLRPSIFLRRLLCRPLRSHFFSYAVTKKGEVGMIGRLESTVFSSTSTRPTAPG